MSTERQVLLASTDAEVRRCRIPPCALWRQPTCRAARAQVTAPSSISAAHPARKGCLACFIAFIARLLCTVLMAKTRVPQVELYLALDPLCDKATGQRCADQLRRYLTSRTAQGELLLRG